MKKLRNTDAGLKKKSITYKKSVYIRYPFCFIKHFYNKADIIRFSNTIETPNILKVNIM